MAVAWAASSPAGDDGMLRTWNLDLTPRDTATELAHGGGVRTVAAIPGEDRPSDGYLSGGNDGILRTWNLDLTPRDTAEPNPSAGGVFSVAVITGPGGEATGYLSGGNDGDPSYLEPRPHPTIDTSIGPEPAGGVFSVAVDHGAGWRGDAAIVSGGVRRDPAVPGTSTSPPGAPPPHPPPAAASHPLRSLPDQAQRRPATSSGGDARGDPHLEPRPHAPRHRPRTRPGQQHRVRGCHVWTRRSAQLVRHRS